MNHPLIELDYKPLGQTSIRIPPIIHGTSCLGNLYKALSDKTKLDILAQIFNYGDGPVVLDTAGKYGAGLALEVIGHGVRELAVPPEKLLVSNKLGWCRTALRTAEPTFEPGVWADLKYDAVQKISYDGILECWEQGNALLGGDFSPQIVSVHDPDEYLALAGSKPEEQRLFTDIVEAYRALVELKEQGVTQAVGVGAKDWRTIRKIAGEIDLDWVMLAISYTVFSHPPELLEFVDELKEKGISVINSAVFHSGFLTGGQFFDYRVLDVQKEQDKPYFLWREKFFALCQQFDFLPADVCVQFGMSHPGVVSIALNTSKPSRVAENVRSATAVIPEDFWIGMKDEGLIDKQYPYVG